MPDDIIISELSSTESIDDNAAIPFSQSNGGTLSTFKGSMSQVASKIAEGTTFSNLETTSKTLVGAINEAAQSGGGSTDIVSEASGTIATFNDGGDNIPVKSLVTEVTATQVGTGTPSPSNVRPITGFDSVEVVVGVNLWNEDWEVGSINEQGNIPSSTRIRTKGYIKVIPSNTYYVKSPNNIWVWGYDENKNYKARIPDTSAISNRTITIPSDVYFIRFVVVDAYGTTYNNDISINYPSTDTAYHHSTITPVPLGQTIYGGTAELVGGNGTKTFGCVDLGDLSWNYAGGTFRAIVSDAISPISGGDTTAICEIYNRAGYSSSIADLSFYLCANQLSASKYLVIKDDSYNGDTNAFKTGVTGKKLIYTLGTPTTFNNTPEQITTLSGTNNIYSNCGDVEVEYFNENADQIAELIDAKQEFCNYSYDEKVVGKWIDGSPLYERTLYFNNVKLDKTDSTSELVHGVDNIGTTRFVAEVYFKFPNSGQDSWSPANNGLWNNGVYNFYWCVGETSIFILSASGVYFDANPNRSYLVKIRYTKA